MPRSNFAQSDLEQLANLILATDGLIRPLILKESGVEQYTVIEGHREYYAALIAKEKDSKKAEMVNAFVINPSIQASALDQLKQLKEDQNSPLKAEIVPSIAEQLLPALLAAISQQIQPIVTQLAEHKQILDVLTLDRISVAALNDRTTTNFQPEPPLKDEKVLPPPFTISVTDTKEIDVKEIELDQIIQPDLSRKEESNLNKETNTLNLINTLDLDRLTLKMKQSKIPNAEKLAVKIIAARNNQSQRTFETWEIVMKEVSGLGNATTQKIIDKLR